MPQSECLERYQSNLPDRPFASRNKQIHLWYDKWEAIRLPYIQANNPWLVRYLVFDLDYTGSEYGYRRRGLPPFTLAAVNRDNGHSHGLYEIVPLPEKKCSQKAQRLLGDVTRIYKELLCADRVITGQKLLSKNCLHEQWRVFEYDKVYTLSELAANMPHEALYPRRKVHVVRGPVELRPFDYYLNTNSRNVSLFEAGRHYAYKAVCECGRVEELSEAVFDHLRALNMKELPKYFPAVLPVSELRSLTRSITVWTWKHQGVFTGKGAGAMGLPKKPYLPFAEWKEEVRRRQSMAAEWVHEKRRGDTRDLLLHALSYVEAEGRKVTVSVLAEVSGMSRWGIYKNHADIVERVKSLKIKVNPPVLGVTGESI